MSHAELRERWYGALIRVPPLLAMDALLSRQLTVGNFEGYPILGEVIHQIMFISCAVLFLLPSSTLMLCYSLVITMTSLKMSQWWNGLFLQKMGVDVRQNSSNTTIPTTISPFPHLEEPEDAIAWQSIVASDEFLLYLVIQLMYSFVFAKALHLGSSLFARDSDVPVLPIWFSFVSPVFVCVFLNAFPSVSTPVTQDIVKSFYHFHVIVPVFLHNTFWSILSFLYYYLVNIKIIVRTYRRIYIQFGLQVLVENQWIRLQVPTVLRLFWLFRLLIQVGILVLSSHYMYRTKEKDTNEEFPEYKELLSSGCYDIVVKSCSTMIAVSGLSATISPIANAIGHLARLFLGGEKDGTESIGTIAAVLFFILALQTGLPDLTPENRVIRLVRNVSLLSTAILHFLHTMLHGVMMQLSTTHVINRQKHARALAMSAALLILPIWFVAYLWTISPVGTWMLALTAFCLELVVKIVVTFVVYVLFCIDTQSDTFWESLDDYVYYVKAVGSTIEFISGVFLFINGAWIFVFESRGFIRAFMICIHAYFNIFQLGKDGWKKFKNRRLAVQKIKSMEQATPEMLSSHDDVCAICYQELSSACVTPCRHLFHAMCLRKWLYMQDSCPLCHKEIILGNDSEERTEEETEQGEEEQEGEEEEGEVEEEKEEEEGKVEDANEDSDDEKKE